ncbi:hypothetical protein R1sor_024095 [Riccia sorocarpa]|uniref:Uncharacterized protein n=1 Tax=Riccia sorocarpa TaxID=122646 RepID=A0ABD3GVI3_9MARC
MESLQEERITQAHDIAVQKICDYGHIEIDRTSVGVNDLMQQIQQDTQEFDRLLPRPLREVNDNTQLEQGRVLHDQLARILYESHIKRSTAPLPEVFTEDPETEAEEIGTYLIRPSSTGITLHAEEEADVVGSPSDRVYCGLTASDEARVDRAFEFLNPVVPSRTYSTAGRKYTRIC